MVCRFGFISHSCFIEWRRTQTPGWISIPKKQRTYCFGFAEWCSIGLAEWEVLDLDQIEPFTLVVFEQTQLHQLRWDGVHKSRMDLDANRAHIWSSATLYSPENRAEREASFFDYLAQKPEVNPADLLDFHQLNLFDRNKTGLLNKPSGALQTISITQLVVHTNTAQLLHFDLPTKNQTVHQINRQT